MLSLIFFFAKVILFATLTVILYSPQNSRSDYNLDEVQISLRSNTTRRKANITEKKPIALGWFSQVCLLVGATIGRPRAFNERPYKQNSAERLSSLPIYVIMGLMRSLSRRERWRRSRRRGLNCAQRTLSPAIAGALPKGEPLNALVQLYGYGLCPVPL